ASRELIDDDNLKETTGYSAAIASADAFFDKQPAFGPDRLPLIKLLKAPIMAAPESLMAQLEFIRTHWEPLLAGLPIFEELLRAQDFLKEEGRYFELVRAMEAHAHADRSKTTDVTQAGFFGWGDKGSAPVSEFKGEYYEYEPERFSADLSWMPRCVLIAKSVFVWLDQLSKKYGRLILRLNEIPNEELDLLASRGFTGLWIIGLWQRSYASQNIKHRHGNIEAAASAYSLNDYEIAPELGGESAYRNLRDRAIHRGIRLASDMVPNHMGIDSRWVIEHPDWFVQTGQPPYPKYSYNGPDLSINDRVGIFIEDGYWNKSDAAVTFKRLDRWTGDTRYIYHGNDGTNMPWNDTAQLNYLLPEVREAVIQTILHVARLFPIIRFDAAMTLAKKHFQRLWYPQPGTGGGVPSRASYSMTKEDFDHHMPMEFWREVVERIQREAPDTLLLAEAFWMMEGYFVRTLGMHRVYNSAFMNMLKKEENANFRTTIKNVLEYNPQILKRHVNFMNNPDEDTAVAQFGKDDKYFGVCILMSTMPGLPMFGHGQVEGYTEKYGHEFRRAYYDEQPDGYLVERHEREIFPVLKKRYLFSDVEHFHLYDCVSDQGYVNEDVFAYSNRFNGERGLVVYNNRFAQAFGWVKMSVGFLSHDGTIVQRSLADGLQLRPDGNAWCIVRDSITNLEYIYSNRELIERGFRVELEAFKYRVLIDFREVFATADKPYDRLAWNLGGRGVASIEDAMADLRLEPVHHAIRTAFSPDNVRDLMLPAANKKPSPEHAETFRSQLNAVYSAAKEVERLDPVSAKAIEEQVTEYSSLPDLLPAANAKQNGWNTVVERVIGSTNSLDGRRVFYAWLLLHETDDVLSRWRLEHVLVQAFSELGADHDSARREVELLRVLLERNTLAALKSAKKLSASMRNIFSDDVIGRFLGLNTYEAIEYFRKEAFEALTDWLVLLRCVVAEDGKKTLSAAWKEHADLLALAEKAGYQTMKFLDIFEEPKEKTPAGKNGNKTPSIRTTSVKKIKS
ncbi:MAG TPA: alpha-amylase family glycosyl hydrolase, partial [Bacteroidota bacterium]|nr:alpha-amylase family glycosyl hydrolase [Bacteroidota bacterium]